MTNMYIVFQNETKLIMEPKSLSELKELIDYKYIENICNCSFFYKDDKGINIEIKDDEQFKKILPELTKQNEPKIYVEEKTKTTEGMIDGKKPEISNKNSEIVSEGENGTKVINNDLTNNNKSSNVENNQKIIEDNNAPSIKPEDTTQKEDEKIKKELEILKDNYNKLENEFKDLKNQYQKLSDENIGLKKEIDIQKKQMNEKNEEIKKKEEEYKEKISENNSLQQKIQMTEKQNEEMKKKIKEYEKEKILNDNKIKEIEKNEEKLKNEISSLQVKHKNEKDETSKKFNEEINKYIEIIKKIEKEKKPICKTIHHEIKCQKCFKEPIVGYRFKCSECKDYDLCQDCEEKNSINGDHPHYFLKIRNEIIEYSYKCLNTKLEMHIHQGVDVAKITITLKNDKIKWLEGTKLIIDRNNSMIDGENINLNPLKKGEQENYEINFKGLKNRSSKEYKVYYDFNVNGKNYGDKLCLSINIENTVDKFRQKYGLAKEKYSDDKILLKLQENNYNFENAFFGLYFS